MNAAFQSVNSENFEKLVLQSPQPVLVDYWAIWCEPCKYLLPILKQVAQDFTGRLICYRLEVTENQAIAKKYDVRGIPTLMLFINGQVVATHVGGDLSLSGLAAFISSHI